jgi:hypothetical protein
MKLSSWILYSSVVILLFILGFAGLPFNKDAEDAIEPASQKDSLLLNSAIDKNNWLTVNNLNMTAYSIANKGFDFLLTKSKLRNDSLLVLIDYSLSANKPRFYIIDIKNNCVLYKSLVAHGVGSGDEFAQRFSNSGQSHQSSLGFYITGEVYNGRHGNSLRLDGLEPDFNSNARSRGVVIHAANYVSEDYIKKAGRIGRSFGCPALPVENYSTIIDMIKDGVCLYIYYPDPLYLQRSEFARL